MADSSDPWYVLARNDPETAEAILRAGRWMYVLFCCQQAVEKRVKGLVASRTGELPPRTHNLMRLTQACGVSPDEVTAQKLRELSAYYIQSRYPDEVQVLARQADSHLAHDVLRQTKEVFRWLESLSPS